MCHPATLVAVLVLLVNDHVAKHLWPGFVTGKLSDVAGLVVAPALLACVLPRRADLAAVVLTGIGFTLVKTTQVGAELASEAWTWVAGPSRVLADPTDLLALPALGLALWIRHLSASPSRARILVGIPLAVLAVTATSGVPGAPDASFVEVRADGIVVSGWDFQPLVSQDGGASWHAMQRQEEEHRGEPRTSACAELRCYRIVADRMKVMESADGGRTWRVSWEVSEGRAKLLDRALDDPRCCRRHPLRSEALAVQVRPGGGHVVVVTNERDGIAVRDEGGTWRRLGFTAGGAGLSTATALTQFGQQVDDETRAAALVGFWVMIVGIVVVAAPGRARRRSIGWLGLVGVLLMMPYDSLFNPELYFMTENPLPWLLGLPGAVITVSVLIGALTLVRGLSAFLKPLGVGVAVALGIALPFYGWSAGVPDDYNVALALAIVVGLGLGGAGLLYLRGSRTSSPT